MNKKIESILYITLYGLFGVWFIREPAQSYYYFYYTVATFLGIGVLFSLTRYFISYRLLNNKIIAPLLVLIIAVVFLFLLSAYLYAAFLGDVFQVNKVSLAEPLVLKQVVPYCILPVVTGLLHLIDLRKQVVRKTARYAGVGMIVLLTGFLVKYTIDINYTGDDSIHFMDDAYQSLDDILEQEQFRNKVVYIDLWFSSCGPCIAEFKKLPALKEQLKDADVEYLYLARETSHPNSKQLWKNAIKKHNLAGWHVYMTDALKENVWGLINKNTGETRGSYPHYLLVNRSGEITAFNAKRPSDSQDLVQQIKALIGE